MARLIPSTWREAAACGVFFLCIALLPVSVSAKEPPFLLPPTSELRKLRTAIIYTHEGELHFDLFPEEAPWHVANFKFLADKGFYRNTTFHIYYPNYIIQGGERVAPGFNYSLPPEFTLKKHEEGALGMARKPDMLNSERASHGTQFHILLGRAAHMDSSYTIFGQLREGRAALRRLRKGDAILDVKVFVRPDQRSGDSR